MRKGSGQKARPNIVSVHLSPEAKQDLDSVCHARGMTIKTLLGRLIEWFVTLDMTEQSIVLGQVEQSDMKPLSDLVRARRGTSPRAGSGARSRRK